MTTLQKIIELYQSSVDKMDNAQIKNSFIPIIENLKTYEEQEKEDLLEAFRQGFIAGYYSPDTVNDVEYNGTDLSYAEMYYKSISE